jgi:hypothetical protein
VSHISEVGWVGLEGYHSSGQCSYALMGLQNTGVHSCYRVEAGIYRQKY